MSILWTSPAWSWPLLLVTAAGALVLTARFYGQSRPQTSVGLRRALVVLRTVALLLLVLGMAGPLLTRLASREVPPRLVLVFEDSASMALESRTEGAARWQAALAMADTLAVGLQQQGLASRPWLLRGNGLGSLRTFQLDDAVIPEPQAHGTSLEGLLGQVRGRTSTEPVAAWVLLADGNETLPAAGRLPEGGAPLFVVGLGDARGGADRMIKDLRYPDTAYAQDRITVEATVVDRFAAAGSETPAVARLLEGKEVLAEQTLQMKDGSAQVELEFLPGREGLRMLELEISPRDNERFLANNRVSLGIDVRKARSRVLVLAPRPGWDVRFLRRAADREARLSLEVVHNTAAGLAFADSLKPFIPPTTTAQWKQFDAVILAGWEDLPSDLDPSLLAEAVNEGLGLMVLPQPPGSVVTRVRPPQAALGDVLPVDLARARWLMGDFFAEPDSLAADHPAFARVLAPGAESFNRGLPPLPGVLTSTARPEAQILLNARGRAAGTTDGIALLSAWDRGQGRAVFWGGTRLWELAFWPAAEGDAGNAAVEVSPMERLLRNLLVWLADGTGESGLSFAGRRSFYQEGEAMAPAARWRDMRGEPVTDRQPTLEVERLDDRLADETGQVMGFSSPGYDPQREEFPFTIPALPPGRYLLRLTGEGNPTVVGEEKEIVITEHSVEKTQVRQDARRLRQLAERLGGRYLDGGDPGAAAQLLRQLGALDWNGAVQTSRRQWQPTAGWPFLVVVVLLLGCEWFLRRRHGLL